MLRAFVLGVVQGLTEFLPISSSAHLSIVPKLLGYAVPSLSFEVFLHFGTLLAVVAYFARDLWGFVLALVAPGRLGASEAAVRRRLLLLLVLASVPAAVLGFLLQDWADRQTSHPLRAAVWLVVTTSVLIAAELYARGRGPVVPVAAEAAAEAELADRGAPGPASAGAVAARPAGRRQAASTSSAEKELERLPAGNALGIGVAQALALIPGTSRSGITISAGLFLGVTREAAARFSFLLSIPAILGAGILKLGDLSGAGESGPELLIGFLASAVAGFLAVSALIRLLRTRTLWPFIWYRLLAGGAFVVLLATVRS
ncbi:MAG TPA: undecaprenyl-diphosphate phosphatase [Actinomycetes bacterium]